MDIDESNTEEENGNRREVVRRDIYLASSSELNNLLNMELLSTMQILSKRVYI